MWWIIPVVILFLVCLIPFLRVRLSLVYDKDLAVKIKVLFIPFTLYPSKKKKLKPKDYSIKNLRKKQKKLKTKKTPDKPKQDKSDKNKKINDILELIKIILDNVLSPFARHLKLEIAQIYIKIATDDAAKTAIYYGLASQSVSYIVEFLSNVTNVAVKSKKSIKVLSDFTSDKSEAKINLTFGLRVWHLATLATKFFLGYNKSKTNKEINNQEAENGQQT